MQLRCRDVCQNPVTKDIFVVDGLNDVIRRISTGGDVSTVVGAPGEVGLVDGEGRLAALLQADTCPHYLPCCPCNAVLCFVIGADLETKAYHVLNAQPQLPTPVLATAPLRRATCAPHQWHVGHQLPHRRKRDRI
jgi:hypothetical protein